MPSQKSNKPVFFDFKPENLGVGHRIKLARIYAGYGSGKDFAEALGINYITYNNYERGRNTLKSQGLFEKMAKLTGVRAEWLKTGEGLMTNDPKLNAALQERWAQRTGLLQKPLDEDLMIEIYQALKAQLNNPTVTDVRLLQLSLKVYKQLSTMNLTEKDRLQVIKGFVKLLNDVGDGVLS